MLKRLRASRREKIGPRSGVVILASIALVGLIVWGAQSILIPLTLALLLSFVGGRSLAFLERCGLAPAAAVAVLSITVFAIFVLGTWQISSQALQLSKQIPVYRHNLVRKIEAVEGTLRTIVQRIRIPPPVRNAPSANPLQVPGGTLPAQSSVFAAQLPLMNNVQNLAPAIIHFFGIATFVIVFSLFLSAYRDDLRDRFIRLAGERKIYVTSELLNEVASKVSAYLWTQLLVNTLFGLSVAACFVAFDFEFALLWGALLGILRFLPFIGIFIGGALPLVFALATDPDWGKALVVLGTVIGTDLLITQFVEPHIMGRRVGLSPVAVLLSAFVWTLVWGVAGLVIATPLTACLVVAGRYFSQLEFATILFSDDPALTPSLKLYHRALSHPDLSADTWLTGYLSTMGREKFFSHLLVPALHLLAKDGQRGKFSRRRLTQICSALSSSAALLQEKSESAEPQPEAHGSVLVFPLNDRIEGVMAELLAAFCSTTGVRWQTFSHPLDMTRVTRLVQATRSRIVVFCSLQPLRTVAIRALATLARSYPSLQIVVFSEHTTEHPIALPSVERTSSAERICELARQLGTPPTNVAATTTNLQTAVTAAESTTVTT